MVKSDYPSGWQYHSLFLRETELMWGFFWPIYFNKNSLLVFSMIYKFITNFLFYFLTIALNQSMMECGCWCPLVFYWVVFFFVVKIIQLSFIIKWDQLEKIAYGNSYKVYYFLFKLTVLTLLDWLLFSSLNLSWINWKLKTDKCSY